MNKAFMSVFYDRFYDDPIHEIVRESAEQIKLRKRLNEAEEKLKAIIGDVGTPAWRVYEATMKVYYEYLDFIAKEMCLKGAKDREKMLE